MLKNRSPVSSENMAPPNCNETKVMQEFGKVTKFLNDVKDTNGNEVDVVPVPRLPPKQRV